jgi:hypothetical protein
MIHSVHFFNTKKQQIYLLRKKPSVKNLFSKNTGKYLALKLRNPFVILRLLLLSAGIMELFM